MKTLKLLKGLVAGLVIILSPYYSHADVKYTYTGNAYDTFQMDPASYMDCPSAYGESNKVTATFTIDERFEPSYSGEVTPSSFTISNGSYTLTQDNTLVFVFWVSIDSGANISQWSFIARAVLMIEGNPHAIEIFSRSSSTLRIFDSSMDYFTGNIDYEQIMMEVESSSLIPPYYAQWAWIYDDPGVWSVSQVREPVPPAPGTMLLLLG